MKTFTILLAVILLFSFPIFPQRNNNKNPTTIRKPKPKIGRICENSEEKQKPIVHSLPPKRIKKPPRKKYPQNKIRVERAQEHENKLSKRNKIHPNITEEYVTIEFEEPEVFDEIDKGYCMAGEIFRKYEYLIMDESYPFFPLRFVSASISYLFTEGENDYFNLELKILANYGSYFEQFGIIVDYGGVEERLLKLNQNEEFLQEGFTYKYSQNISINNLGYKNIRIGYFDSDNRLFYPENFSPKKTDILIYVEKRKEKRIRKIRTYDLTKHNN